MKNNRQYNFTVGLLIVYLIVLTWIILFKLTLDFSQLGHLRNINLIPFGGSAIVNGRVHIKEIIYNILVFVPMGIYLNMLRSKWPFIKKIIPCFLTSVLFEVLQFIFGIGASDITDLIGNTLGGIAGIGIFYVVQKVFKDKGILIMNILSLTATVIVILLLSLLFIANI